MDKVALIIVFNHNYEENLTILDSIYAKRFSHIHYVMPFYSGDRADVISVYDSSYYFQGFIAKAISQLKSENFDYFFTIADDLYLNPEINEHNFKNYFEVDEHTSFLPHPFLLTDTKETKPSRPFAPFWNGIEKAINFDIKQPGILAEPLLPTYESALNLLDKHQIKFKKNVPKQMFFSFLSLKNITNQSFLRFQYQKLRLFLTNFKYLFSKQTIKYPLVGSYADIIIIPKEYTQEFTKYCYAFTALNLFVELALPTALLFASEKVKSEKDIEFKGETYWYYNHDICEKKYKKSLSYLENNFSDKTLYVHPIKLSKWK